MDFHKLLMGHRYDDLPAQTVMDHKVSVAIGSFLMVQMVVITGLMVTVAIQNHRIEKLKESKE